MGKAGLALQQTLERHNISQNQLAVAMGVDRSNISRWVNQSRDPSAEALHHLYHSLDRLNPAAAQTFLHLYLHDRPIDPTP